MTANVHRESAKIYKFPTAIRMTAVTTAVGASQKANSVVALGSQRATKATFGESWYHEAAIQEEQDRKR